MQHIVVVGGSGFIGSHLCNRLCTAGYRLTVPSRRFAHTRHLLPLPTLEAVEVDIHDDAALDRLLANADAVINLVGVLHSPSGSPYGSAFAKSHVALPERLAKACDQRGVHHLIHISALGADANGPSEYQRSKAAGEQAIREKAGNTVWTLLRPSVVFGPGDQFINLFAGLCQAFPLIPLAGAQARFQPVFVGDVVKVIERCLQTPESHYQTFELAGPRIYTLADLVRFAGSMVHCTPRILSLPHAMAMLQASMMECLPNPLMSRDNVRSMQRDNVASGTPLPFGLTPTGIESAVPAYIRGNASRTRFSDLRRKARRDSYLFY